MAMLVFVRRHTDKISIFISNLPYRIGALFCLSHFVVVRVEYFKTCFRTLTCQIVVNTAWYCHSQTWQPVLTPNCQSLTPQPCTVIPIVDSNGDYTYDSYLEDCNAHQCTTISPVSTSYSWTDTSPPYATSTIEPWFCDASMVSYQARVEVNTGLPPGKKEDRFAQCNYNRLSDFLTFMNCRDRKTWKCSDCLQAYKYWVCAISFPQCTPSPPLHESTVGPFDVEHAVYGTKLNPYIYVNYTIIKPCRGVCFDVYRKCPYAVGFQCPWKDSRDYHDWPNCNLAGNLNAIRG